MAHIMWLEVGIEFRDPFGRWVQMAKETGHLMTPIMLKPGEPVATWIADADSYIVRTTGYIDQEELLPAFEEALEDGRRVLFLVPGFGMSRSHEGTVIHDDFNPWLERRFGLVTTTNQHWSLQRYADSRWEGRRDVDELVAKPAVAELEYEYVMDSVHEVVMRRPRGLRCFDRARPLLEVKLADLVDTSDLPVPKDTLTDDDRCVAAMSGPEGWKTPQVIVLGAGDCLVDDFTGRANKDNGALARNLIRWLSGERFAVDLAAEARDVLAGIELTLWSMIYETLRERHGADGWADGLPENLKAKLRERRPGLPLEQALDLSDMVNFARKDAELSVELIQIDGLSKTKAVPMWSSAIDLRHIPAHPVRLKTPITQEAIDNARGLQAHLARCRRRRRDAEDEDPAR